ncbi:hypothetical protein HUJ04_011561 [Dendroctonus ponderosae]
MLKILNYCVLHSDKTTDVSLRLINVLSKPMSSCTAIDSGANLRKLFAGAVKAVQPASLINNQVKLADGHLTVSDQSFPLAKSCHVAGFGKAVLGMALELERTLGNRLKRAIVVVPKGIFQNYPQFKQENSKIAFIEGAANNMPDRDALVGAQSIKKLAEELQEDDLLLVLISGGGSALLPLPKPPITLEEKQNVIQGLSRGGANITELNTVRKHLSLLKGGGLAKLAYPSRVISLILSDVVGDPLEVIASGPTVDFQEDPDEAIQILEKFGLYESAPLSIKTVLESREMQSNHGGNETACTPCQNSNNSSTEKSFPNGKFNHVSNFIIGTNRIATDAAKSLAMAWHWQTIIVSHKVEEDVNRLAEIYVQLAYLIIDGKLLKIKELLVGLPFELEENAVRDILGLHRSRKMLLIFAGEPTVRVTGTGKGGRNQQLALAFSLQLNKQATQASNSAFKDLPELMVRPMRPAPLYPLD